MPTGNVKWFNPTKGYGFIQSQGGGRDVFVHISAVERAGLSTLNEGEKIQYEIASKRGKESAETQKWANGLNRPATLAAVQKIVDGLMRRDELPEWKDA